MAAKQLIVNADDYGLTAGVSAGIRRAHSNGIITSTTALMNRPNVEAELKIASAECPALGIGVHLNLTSGDPILPPAQVSTLMKVFDQHDHGLHRLDMIGQLNRAEVRAEWRAQIEKFIRATGHTPDHLDSHHHSSYYTPELCSLMLDMAREYHCAIRLPLINSGDAGSTFDDLPIDLRDRAKQEIPKILINTINVPKPEHFIADFYDETATQETLLRIIDALPDGVSELMTHPGYNDAALTAFSSYNEPRARELGVLIDPEVRNYLKANQIELISFAKLKHA
jgi:predicted glycoside hydrolase/deacetylase ChbG (UPF0249 family)